MKTYVVNPVKVRMQESDKGMIYRSIVALGFRARQINDSIRYEIQDRMSTILDTGETEGVNFDQMQISREFDKLPKPTFIAMKEMMDGKLHYEVPEKKEIPE